MTIIGKNLGKKIAYIVFAYYILSYILVYTFNMPRILLYVGDALNVLSFLLALLKNKSANKTKDMILFTLFGVFSALINFESITLILWGIKNNVRFFTFFYTIITFFDITDIEKVKRTIKIVFFISVPLCTVERFLVSYPSGTIIGDMIGGIFWNYSGCNTPLNVIISLFMIDVANKYYSGKTSSIYFIIVCCLAFYMAALAELKIFLVEFVVIILMTTILNKISFKSVLKIIVVAIIFSSFISYFIEVNQTGDEYANNYTLEGFFEYATRDSGYTGENDLNRLTGMITISEKIFKDNYIFKLVGVGLGNAEYTNFFSSSFFKQHGELNYQWFHDIWLYIETGIVGIIFFCLIFITVYKASNKYLKYTEYNNYVKVAIVLMIILFLYNISLRTETSGFLLYIVLAIPYIYNKSMNKKKEEN